MQPPPPPPRPGFHFPPLHVHPPIYVNFLVMILCPVRTIIKTIKKYLSYRQYRLLSLIHTLLIVDIENCTNSDIKKLLTGILETSFYSQVE